MAGTREGGLKAAETNRIIHGEDFYSKIGHKGGSYGHTGGFASMPREWVSFVGSKGGRNRRGKGYTPHYAKRVLRDGKEILKILVRCKSRGTKKVSVRYGYKH